jgi:hypothetical protein
MQLIGLVALSDPPRSDAAALISELKTLAGCGKSRLGKKARKTNRAQLPQERKKGRG